MQKSEIQLCPPAIYFAEQLDRVTAVQHETTTEIENRRLRGGAIQHGATVAYLLREVELVDGWLYSRSLREKGAHCRQHLLVPPTLETLGLAALSSSLPGNTYFGHWLTDDLLLHEAAGSMAPPIMVDRGYDYSHELGYCQLLNVKQRKLSRARFQELIVLDDIGQNSFKRQRYQELRSRLRRTVADSGAEFIYIRRGTAMAQANRQLVNAAEIETFLQSHGFVIVDPDVQTAAEIARATMNARIIVGVEGSHLNHGLLPLAEGGTICCLQPPYRFNNVFKDLADCLHANYAMLIGTVAEGGFKMPIEDMKRMFDRLEKG